MTPEQVRIVQQTWLKLLPVKHTTARLFYDKLFEIDPSLRNLFPSNMQTHGDEFLRFLDTTITGLDRLQQVLPEVQNLGRRHVGYGVQGYHYGALGAALLWALDQALNKDFTVPVKDAWASFYGLLASTMREAAAKAVD